MPLQDDDLQEILTIFKSESEEHLQKLNEGILGLERDPQNRDILEEVFREAHSMKGAARMIGFGEVERISHAMEDLFNEARKGSIALCGSIADVVLQGLDLINRVVTDRLHGSSSGSPLDEAIDDYLVRLGSHCRPGSPPVEPGDSLPDLEALHASPAPPVEEFIGVPSAAGATEQPLPVVSPPAGEIPAAGTLSTPQAELPDDEAGQITVNIGVRDELRRDFQAAEERVKVRRRRDEATQVTPQFEETIRVPVEKLDELMSHVGEILVTKIRSDQLLLESREYLASISALQRGLHRRMRRRGATGDCDGSTGVFLAAQAKMVDDLAEKASLIVDGLSDENLRLDIISASIQESVNRIRMLPLSAIFNFFPRLVRDISREQGKEVELVIRGGETRLDKRILEELKDPLTHLLRNSIDHGLESSDEREAAGKNRLGELRLTASQKGNSVLVELSDDGRGIDPEYIRQVALKRGFVAPETLAEMTPSQVMQIIFQPGFTTKSIITDVSGRGVGLDVVLTNIEKLKGKISTASTPGRGTRFSITLPLTLATTQALLIRLGEQRFAIPLTAVELTGEVDISEVSLVEGKETVLVNGQPLNLIRLAEILKLPDHAAPGEMMKLSLVVLSSTDDRVAFLVDELIGEREVVVKSLGPNLLRVPNVGAATILADGTPVMILNVFDLIKNARKSRGTWLIDKAGRQEPRRKHTIMVVDDSITTRTLEKNILESGGYEVVTAVDGQEALDKLKTRSVDLVVSDVQMPRIDGFSLTSTLKADKHLSALPIILVTSLESEDDKRRGIESGADAYITKGSFDQGNLLATIRQLL